MFYTIEIIVAVSYHNLITHISKLSLNTTHFKLSKLRYVNVKNNAIIGQCTFQCEYLSRGNIGKLIVMMLKVQGRRRRQEPANVKHNFFCNRNKQQ